MSDHGPYSDWPEEDFRSANAAVSVLAAPQTAAALKNSRRFIGPRTRSRTRPETNNPVALPFELWQIQFCNRRLLIAAFIDCTLFST
jgi:hypothetical protein